MKMKAHQFYPTQVKRFKAYLSVLTAIRLEPIRERILSTACAGGTDTECITQQSRSASVHNLVTSQNNQNVMKARKDYYVESP